jgi:ABC-type Zn uptake system ZnuABC Zn-binding protein ZnuA
MFAMVRRALGVVCGVGVVFAGLAGCGGEGAASSAAAPSIDPAVRTSFYPATYFAERIAGGLVPVESPLPEGEDPIFWTPDAETIGLYQRAKLIVLNGA